MLAINLTLAAKQAIRLSRRCHRHGVHNVNFSITLADITMEVGRRVVHINTDGEIRQQFRPAYTSLGWRADQQGMTAFRSRIQAIYMMRAAISRSNHRASEGRIMVDAARLDRLYGG